MDGWLDGWMKAIVETTEMDKSSENSIENGRRIFTYLYIFILTIFVLLLNKDYCLDPCVCIPLKFWMETDAKAMKRKNRTKNTKPNRELRVEIDPAPFLLLFCRRINEYAHIHGMHFAEKNSRFNRIAMKKKNRLINMESRVELRVE